MDSYARRCRVIRLQEHCEDMDFCRWHPERITKCVAINNYKPDYILEEEINSIPASRAAVGMCPPVETLVNNVTEGGISAVFAALLKILIFYLLAWASRLDLKAKIYKIWEGILGFTGRVAGAAKNQPRMDTV